MDTTHASRWTTHFYLSGKEKTMDTRYILTLCTTLVIGGALSTGSAHAVSKGVEKTQINDTLMTAKTKIALFADPRIKGREISVQTSQASVMIRGKVYSDEAKQAAEAITKGIDGVKSVRNKLQVVVPSKQEATDDKDGWITVRVIAKIANDYALDGAGVHAVTNAGVVSLSGDVSSLVISAQASSIAWQVSGVKSVKNDLTVKEKF